MKTARIVPCLTCAALAALVILLAGPSVFAQEGPARPVRPTGPPRVAPMPLPQGAESVSRLIRVQTVDVNDLLNILSVVGRNCEFGASAALKVIAVRGPAAEVEEVAQACKELDTAIAPEGRVAPNIELTLYVLDAGEDAGAEGGESAVPAGLQGMAAQLKQTFGYARYGLLDTLQVRCKSGDEVEASGFLPGQGEGEPPALKLSVGRISLQSGEGGDVVCLNQCVVGAEVQVVSGQSGPQPGPNPPVSRAMRVSRRDVGLRTDIDVPPGQKILAGKLNVDGTRQTLFFVIEANVVK